MIKLVPNISRTAEPLAPVSPDKRAPICAIIGSFREGDVPGSILQPLMDSPSAGRYTRRARATLNDARQRNTTAVSGKHGNVLTGLDPFSQR